MDYWLSSDDSGTCGDYFQCVKYAKMVVRHWHVKLNCWNEIRFWESKTQTLVFNEFQSCLVLLESDSCDVASGLFKAEARLLHMFEMENVWLNTKLQD